MTSTTRPARSLLALPPLLLLTLAGCTAEREEDGATAAPTVTVTAAAPSASTGGTPSASPAASGEALAAVAAAAERAAGSSTIVSVDQDDDGTWDAVAVDADGAERELRLSSAGDVVAGPTTDDSDAADRRENRALVDGARTSLQDAAAAALRAAGGGRLTEPALDDDRGAVVWEAQVEGSPDGVGDVSVDVDTGRATA